MATPVVASSSTATSASTGTITITKPTGLAVGDDLYAVIWAMSGTAPSITVPSGWSTVNGVNGNGNTNFQVMTKRADSSDVAASNFSFTVTASTVGALLRVTGGATLYVSEVDTYNGSSTSTVSFTGSSTPLKSDSLLLSFFGVGSGTTTPATFSGYTSTPSFTWTEIVDANLNDGVYFPSLAVASTTVSSLTQNTAYGVGLSRGEPLHCGMLLLIRDPASASGTTNLLSVSPTMFTENGVAGVVGTTNLLSVSPTINTQSGHAQSMPVWINPDKGTTTWTNPDK